MNSDRINRWLTLVANLGVLVGIVLVVIELDQNRDMMRSQIRYQASQDEANYNLAIATDRQLIEVMWRAGQGEELSGADRVQNFIRLIACFRIQENIYFEFREGFLEPGEYEGIKAARHGFVGVSEETARAWCTVRQGVSAEFRAEMDQSFTNLDCPN